MSLAICHWRLGSWSSVFGATAICDKKWFGPATFILCCSRPIPLRFTQARSTQFRNAVGAIRSRSAQKIGKELEAPYDSLQTIQLTPIATNGTS